VYNSVLEQLEKAISLKEDGLILESDAVINLLSLEVEKIRVQFDEPKEKTENLNFDKSTLPRRGQLLAENDMVILRTISDEDYEDYMKVSYECAIMKSAFKEDTFKKDLKDAAESTDRVNRLAGLMQAYDSQLSVGSFSIISQWSPYQKVWVIMKKPMIQKEILFLKVVE